MRQRLLVSATLLMMALAAASAEAQVNGCATDPPPRTVALSAESPLTLHFTSPSHALVDPDGQAVVTDYLGEVMVDGQQTVVSNWTIPKGSLQAQTGVPANCYATPVPAMEGLLPANRYVIRVTARGRNGQTAVSEVSTDGFFLVGAPAELGRPRLVAPTP